MQSSYNILNIIKSALGGVDERLVEHEERVAFIADTIMKYAPVPNKIDRHTLFMLCSLHDIGAYKTEEIEDMFHFETHNVVNHAVYGYLFLKRMPLIGEYAESILYHHTDYEKLENLPIKHREYAELIFLSDRVDILIQNEIPLEFLKQSEAGRFNPRFIELLFTAEQDIGLSHQIRSGNYMDAITDAKKSFNFSASDVMLYLRMLVYAIDFHSEFTVTHTVNTVEVSMNLGRFCGLSENELDKLYHGAFLHDIGKISIPAEILEAPNQLDGDLMRKMKTHVEKTEEILKGLVDDDVCKIAARHHEKLDGSGYPHGLCAQELSLSERIVAVADIVSALCGKRSYKEPFPKEKVIAIISRMRDNGELDKMLCNLVIKQYDEIAQSICRSSEQILDIYDEMSSEYLYLQKNFNG